MMSKRDKWFRGVGQRLLSILTVASAFLLLSNLAMKAQTISSSVEGTVTDTSGATVPAADVTLTSLDTGVALKTVTDAVGRYAFPSISLGRYSLKVSKQGFTSYQLADFQVVAAQQTGRDVVLSVGQVSQTVTVSASGLTNLLQTNSNDLSTLIESQSVSQLPLNGRNYLQLALLSAAATSVASSPTAGVAGQTGRSLNTINIAGIESDLTMFLIDGMQVRGTRAGNSALDLPVGAIDQFQVHYGFFTPSLGPDPGVVDLLTKSGSNRFHGEAYEFVRNNAWEARNFFSSTPPGPFHMNQFGGDVGGPIRKEKAFFFGNYEGFREDQSAYMGAFAPTQAMFGGNFSALSTPIYNPFSYNATTGQRQAFTGNIIPTNMISPVASALLKYYLPGSSYSDTPINVSGDPRTTLDYDQFTVRTDVNLSERNRIFARFNYENSPQTAPAGINPLQGVSHPLNTQLAMVGWTFNPTAAMVNEARIGWARDTIWQEGQTVTGLENQLGITGTADQNGVPSVNLSGIGSFGDASGQLGDGDDSYQVHDALSWLHGNHMIKFGGDLNYMRTIQDSANGNARGVLSFTNDFSSQLASNAPMSGTGNSFADFLLGLPTTASTSAMPRMHWKWTTFSPYIEDTWKVRPRLTLNLGLGYSLSTPPNPIGPDKNNIHSFDFNTGHILYAAIGQVSPEIYPLSPHNFAPRVGFAWQPGFVNNTVVRAGWGIYYSLDDLFAFQDGVVAPGITLTQSIANTEPSPTYLFGQNVLPQIALAPTITAAYAQSVTGSLYYLPSIPMNPYVEQWTFDIQHTFGQRNLLDVAYLGNEGHHLLLGWDANDCPVSATLQCNSAAIPYPAFPYIFETGPVGNSNYQALLVKFRRQFSNGLSVLANYTYSKTIAMGSQGGNGTASQFASCRSCDSGPAIFSSPETLSLSAVWDLPVGQGHKWLTNANRTLNAVAGGWELNVISTFDHGAPFEVTAPNTTVFPYRTVRANRLCNGSDSSPDLRSNGLVWINTACFAAPAAGYFGNSGMGILTGPGINDWDIGMHKAFSIGEKARLELRGEFFNAFNHAQFANPDAGVTDVIFGKVTSTQHDAFEAQLGIRLVF